MTALILFSLQRQVAKPYITEVVNYTTFTSKERLSRLARRSQTASSNQPSTSQTKTPVEKTPRSSMLRSSVALCIFCQDLKVKGRLYNVATFDTSKQILEASKYDPVIHVRLSGVSDLIASEGKYHVNCYNKFLWRTTTKKEWADVEAGVAMKWLISELKDTARKAQVLDLSGLELLL